MATSTNYSSTPAPRTTVQPEDRIGQLLGGHLELTGILGVGAYGVVYTAVDIYTHMHFAVKALSKDELDSRQRRFQQREISLHHKASAHPNVVSLKKILEAPDCTYVVIEFCPEGDLFSNITERGQFVGNDPLAKRVFLQLLDAVEYCHSIGIYHRDLKPENVLVCERGTRVKLADFGLATTEPVTTDFGCGSTFYMSPECQQQGNGTKNFRQSGRPISCYASAPNDVWSLGVILVNLTCGRNPWKRASLSDSTFRAYLKDPRFLRTILPLSLELDAILRRIFEIDPNKRATIRELRQWISTCPRFTTGPAQADTPATTPVYECSPPVAQSQYIRFDRLPATPPTTPPLTPSFEPTDASKQFGQLSVPSSPPVVVSHPNSKQQEYQAQVPAAPRGRHGRSLFEKASENLRSHIFPSHNHGHFVAGPQGVQCC